MNSFLLKVPLWRESAETFCLSLLLTTLSLCVVLKEFMWKHNKEGETIEGNKTTDVRHFNRHSNTSTSSHNAIFDKALWDRVIAEKNLETAG